MFRAVYRSSSGALTLFAASGLHTHVVTGRSQVDYGRSPHAYVNQRLQIQLELLMMSGMLLETCWAFNERWNNKFCYNVAYCWLFLLSHFFNPFFLPLFLWFFRAFLPWFISTPFFHSLFSSFLFLSTFLTNFMFTSSLIKQPLALLFVHIN